MTFNFQLKYTTMRVFFSTFSIVLLFIVSNGLAQPVTNILLTNDTFIAGNGSANSFVGTIQVIGYTPFNGRLRLVGQNAGNFQILGTLLYVGPLDLQQGDYIFNIQAMGN